ANIAVGDHPHHFLAIADDRQKAEIASPHLHRCFGQICFRPAALRVVSHYILYFHIFSPFFDWEPTPRSRAALGEFCEGLYKFCRSRTEFSRSEPKIFSDGREAA